MWYKGTEQECIDYNELVTSNENYQDTTNNWSDIYYNDNTGEYIVSLNFKYSSTMEIVYELDETWYDETGKLTNKL